ncbi:hypothetical protein ACFQ3R_00075 [Mesonia ostreae]|uniref:hypothetical protein n=1 Tax=Mesonia ostreae TaxID=861110 RepID=UPI003643F159
MKVLNTTPNLRENPNSILTLNLEKKKPNISVGLVLEAGIEPARPKTLDFESSVFDNEIN